MTSEVFTRAYRVAMGVAGPIVRRWGRLEVTGLDLIPLSGPLLIVANHDSQWDPVIIGVSAIKQRQIHALAKSELWKNKALARVLDGMGQIPIERGRGDARALDAAVTELQRGACIGVFPEGTVSRGRPTRVRSGAGRLLKSVPETSLICCRVLGSVDVVRFPKRPRIKVEFFLPEGGQPRAEETPLEVMQRSVTEIRSAAPFVLPGRKKKAAHLRAIAAAEENAPEPGARPVIEKPE